MNQPKVFTCKDLTPKEVIEAQTEDMTMSLRSLLTYCNEQKATEIEIKAVNRLISLIPLWKNILLETLEANPDLALLMLRTLTVYIYKPEHSETLLRFMHTLMKAEEVVFKEVLNMTNLRGGTLQ